MARQLGHADGLDRRFVPAAVILAKRLGSDIATMLSLKKQIGWLLALDLFAQRVTDELRHGYVPRLVAFRRALLEGRAHFGDALGDMQPVTLEIHVPHRQRGCLAPTQSA